MYRHLLVPIDNSDLSTVTIGRAVEFALALGARITFFQCRWRSVVTAAPNQHLLVTILRRHIGFVQALQATVMALV